MGWVAKARRKGVERARGLRWESLEMRAVRASARGGKSEMRVSCLIDEGRGGESRKPGGRTMVGGDGRT